MTLLDARPERLAPGPADQCLHELFEGVVDRAPDALALLPVGDESARTYAELDAEANRLAHLLRSRGVGPGGLVGILFERSSRPIVAILAILKAGAGYVPFEPSYPEDRIRYIVGEAGIGLILTETVLLERAEAAAPGLAIAVESIVDELDGLPSCRIAPASIGLAPTDLCYVIYTSGTTGRPKGVMTEHRNARDFVLSFNEVCSTTADDRVYQGFALTFDGSVEEIWMAFSNGAVLVVPDRATPRFGDDLAEVLDRHAVTYFSTVPTMLSTMARQLPALTQLVVSGEVCPPALVERWAVPGRRMLNVYGPTEGTVNTTAADLRADRPVTIGRPIPGYTVHILDEEMRPVPHGAEGELYVGGVGVSRGYLGRPDLTAERYVTSPHVDGGESRLYRTGDLVRWREDGDLDFFGRLDGQVKIRGFRVELAEIESVLREAPGVAAAAAKLADREGIPVLAAYVVPADPSSPPDRVALLARLEARLPDYMVPGYLDLLDELPTLTSGKTDRGRLPAPVAPLAPEAAHVEPRTPLETAVTAAWAELFGMERISVEADFFTDLGGHSLLAARAVALLRERNDSELAVRDIYANPTARALAAALLAREAAATIGATREQVAGAEDAAGVPNGVGPTAAETFAATPIGVRRLTNLLMGLSIGPLAAIPLLPLLVFGILEYRVLTDDFAVAQALLLGGIAGLLSIPAGLLFSIAVKWAVVGRYRPGVHPLWTPFHWRWWLVERVVAVSGAGLLLGTPLLPLYYRAMGARIGRRVVIDTIHASAWDLISIGDDSSIAQDARLHGIHVEAGRIVVDRVEIGAGCFVGTNAILGSGVRLGDGSRIDDQTMIPDGTVVPAGEGRRGSPPVPAEVPVPEGAPYRPGTRRLLGFGLGQLLTGVVLEQAMALPSMLVFLAVLAVAIDVGAAAAAALLAVLIPLDVVANAIWFALLRRVALPSGRPGVHRLYGSVHYRKWLSDLVVHRARNTLYPLQTTLYLPPWLRLMGARIGARAEFATIRNIAPELTEVGEESFFADDVALGSKRTYDGLVRMDVDRIGRRTFMGNSSLLPSGVELGDHCLVGVLSAAPAQLARVPDGTDWLGSPAFRLANRQREHVFDERLTYRPTRSLYVQRAVIDGLRILLPTAWVLALAQLEAQLVLGAAEALGFAGALAALPFIGLLGAGASVAVTLAVKWLVMGRYRPVVVPLWSRYAWLNELVNGFFEWVMHPAVAPLVGTPFLALPLRAMGCRIGRDAYVGTLWFTEWDLVEIGDHASVNEGSTVQTHLFEDRVMKSSWSRVGAGATVGIASVVLYDTLVGKDAVLGPLSLVMKGETVPAGRRAHGIPGTVIGRTVADAPETVVEAPGAGATERVVVLTRDGWVVGRAPAAGLAGLLGSTMASLTVTVPQGPCELTRDEILLVVREGDRETGAASRPAPTPLTRKRRVDLGWATLEGRVPAADGAAYLVVEDATLRFPHGSEERAGRVYLASAARDGAAMPEGHPLAAAFRAAMAPAG